MMRNEHEQSQQASTREYVAPAATVVGTLAGLTASKPGPFSDATGGIDFPSNLAP